MNRQKIKGTRHKGANNPEQEPDFYSMPPLGPSRMTSSGSLYSGCVGPIGTPPSLSISPAVVTPTCSGANSKIMSTSKADDLSESMLAKGGASAVSFPQLVDAKSSAKEKVGGPIYSRDSDVIEPLDLFDVSTDELEDSFFRPFASQSQIKDGVATSKSAVETGSRVSTSCLPDDDDEIFNSIFISDEEKMLIDDESFHDCVW